MKRVDFIISHEVRFPVEVKLLKYYDHSIPEEFQNILINIFRYEIHDAIKDDVWNMVNEEC